MKPIDERISKFFAEFDSARQMRKFIPESMVDDPLGEEWQLWHVSHGDAICNVVVQIYSGSTERGDNGFEVFMQACSANSVGETLRAVKEVMAERHPAEIRTGY